MQTAELALHSSKQGKSETVQPSLRRNLLANYASQFYVMAIGIVMSPVYLTFMGTEAYGLVGFFAMMTAWFQLLDMGLSPTLVRETARYRGGAINVQMLRALLRILEAIFGGISVVGMAAMVLLAHSVATRWLNVKSLPIDQVFWSLIFMGFAIPLRWMSGLYRGLVNGFEQQVWLGWFSAAIATARFVAVLGVFVTFGVSPVYFFAYQLIVAFVELVGLCLVSYRLMPGTAAPRANLSWAPLRQSMAFSMTIAFTATVWVFVTQTDKLVLSKWLPLPAFGMFSIAVVAAGAVNAVGVPFGQALLPRLTKLITENDASGAARLYSVGTQLVCVLVSPAVGMLIFIAQPVLQAWTGNVEVASEAAPILALYAAGNGWIALCSFAYYIQFARGELRLHFIGNVIVAGVMAPATIWAAWRYGAFGTGVVWVFVNGCYALFWIPLVHARFLPGRHVKWMTNDVALVVVPTFLAAWTCRSVVTWSQSRVSLIFELAAIGLLLLLIASVCSSVVRMRGGALLRSYLMRMTNAVS